MQLLGLRSKSTWSKQDYVPFELGIMVFGGLLAIPIVWSILDDITYLKALIPSLLSSAIFAISFNQKGEFSFGTYFKGLFILLLMSIASPAHKPVILITGILGIVALLGGGKFGVYIGRHLRGVTSVEDLESEISIVKESESNRPLHPSEIDAGNITTIVEEIPTDPIQGLLARTYNEHLFGEMKDFDGLIKDKASLYSFKGFSAAHIQNEMYFDKFLKHHNIGKDEFIGAYWLETKYPFILTNKCLFLPNEKVLISLENVRSFSVKGTFFQTLTMKILPDEKVTFKVRGLRSDIFEYLLKRSANEPKGKYL